MEFHNPIDEIVGNCILVPTIFANITVIYMSLRCVKSSLMQKFALNLCVPSLAFSIYSITVVAVKHANHSEKLDQVSGMATSRQQNSFLDRTADFVLYVCAYDYQLLVILLVAITYATFAHPIFVKTHFRGWFTHVLFFACHFSSIVLTFIAMTTDDETESLVYDLFPATIGINWADIVEAVFYFASFAVLLTLYSICIIAIVGFNRRNSVLAQKSKELSATQKQLLAILAYITPPNVFVIPTTFCIDLLAVLLNSGTPVFAQVCHVKIIYHDSLMATRLFTSSAGILIAFPDYRHALLRIFCKQRVAVKVLRTA